MGNLSADQRNYYYLLEAERAGIHKPVLAALYAVHGAPLLNDGETGLGISPINKISPSELQTFPGQVQYAANTIRSITDRLTAQGWRGNDIWDADEGRYTDRFFNIVAEGYSPPTNDTSAALLEASNGEALRETYLEDLRIDYQADQLPQNLAYLDGALLTFTERLPRYYVGLVQQREALMAGYRIWRKLESRQAVLNGLREMPPDAPLPDVLNEEVVDQALMIFVQNITRYYAGYPHQREALIRLVQLWRELESRETAIASLQENYSAETNIGILDPALIAFVRRIPRYYRGQATQRNAVTEAFRRWRELDSRTSALLALGVNPQLFSSTTKLDPEQLRDIATQLDRQLVAFVQRIPTAYQERNHQREALLRLVQLWRDLDDREATLQSLLEDVRRMQRARRDSPDAFPPPVPAPLPLRPSRWTPSNIQIYAPILPNGNFTWAEATRGGTRMPTEQVSVDAVVRIAILAQDARDRIGRPFHVTSWYRPPEINRSVGGVSNSRHIVGDAIDFYCDGLTGDQIYWALDAWWPGGLGRYSRFPYLCHIDARGYRARWQN